MKKNVIFGLLIIALSILVFACGSAPAPKPDPAPAPAPAPAPTPAQTGLDLVGVANYTVVRGDTLAEIAARRYGGSNMYYFPLIRLANAATVSADPDVLEVGTTLIIPDLQRNLNNSGAKALIKQDMISIASQYERQSKPNAASKLKTLAKGL